MTIQNHMMRPYGFIIIGFLFVAWNHVLAQSRVTQSAKPIIDTNRSSGWLDRPELTGMGSIISPLGHYVSYHYQKDNRLVIKAITAGWSREFMNANCCFFSNDEKIAIVYAKDSLYVIQPGTGQPGESIAISEMPNQECKGRWIVYKDRSPEKKLVFFDLLNRQRKTIGPCKRIELSSNDAQLALEDNNAGLEYVRFNDNFRQRILDNASGNQKLDNFEWNERGDRLFFTTKDTAKRNKRLSIWYWKPGMAKARMLLNDQDARIAGYSISNIGGFNRSGTWLEIKLERIDTSKKMAKPRTNGVKVSVWNYKSRLNPGSGEQAVPKSPDQTYGFVSTGTGILTRSEPGEEPSVYFHHDYGDFIVTRKQDSVRNLRSFYSYFLLSLQDGSKKKLMNATDLFRESNFSFSPDDRWLVYQSAKNFDWYSYNLINHKTTLIARHQQMQFDDKAPGAYMMKDLTQVIAGWADGGNSALIYGNYDIWKADLTGQKPVECVTGLYGKNHHTQLRLINELAHSHDVVFRKDDTLLFTGFNITDKYNGFYAQVLGQQRQPRKKYSGPRAFFLPFNLGDRANRHPIDNSMQGRINAIEPIKAKNARAWVLVRQSATEYPNYVYTTDFSHFTPVTDFQPQKQYNWLTAELINYKTLDGINCQGILYKPENFDPKKKYPVMFGYYETMSNGLWLFPKPEFGMSARIDIPWFTSRGYLVFMPDIPLDMANQSGVTGGEHAYNSIVAGAQTLAKLPFVDSRHMGIQGHSFGGYETNYLVTHTNLFAAASAMAGLSDMVSAYLEARVWYSSCNYFEDGQGRIGANLWQRPDLYLKASPVLKADQVKTPLLLVHGKKDDTVPIDQATEFFMALKRLEKPCWLLAYEDADHGIDDRPTQKDYAIRMTQFFDHYLKGYPPPVWMTKGTGHDYELDPQGSCSEKCPVCKKKDYSNYYELHPGAGSN